MRFLIRTSAFFSSSLKLSKLFFSFSSGTLKSSSFRPSNCAVYFFKASSLFCFTSSIIDRTLSMFSLSVLSSLVNICLKVSAFIQSLQFHLKIHRCCLPSYRTSAYSQSDAPVHREFFHTQADHYHVKYSLSVQYPQYRLPVRGSARVLLNH